MCSALVEHDIPGTYERILLMLQLWDPRDTLFMEDAMNKREMKSPVGIFAGSFGVSAPSLYW